MTKEESLALLAQGRDAWNAWANALLAERARLEEAGEWQATERDWRDRSWVDFEEHEFENDVSFSEFLFPGTAAFNQTKFADNVEFSYAKFSGSAQFRSAKFSGNASYTNSEFSNGADFHGATVFGHAGFNNTTFLSLAHFENARFLGHTGFNNTTFSTGAVFKSVEFSLYGHTGFVCTKFSAKANFKQAIFPGYAEFRDAQFMSYADFEQAVFSGQVRLSNAEFCAHAQFSAATFSSYTEFNDATFSRNAEFGGATFSDTAWFDGATFSRNARFGQTKFTGYSSFQRARFLGNATFEATDVQSAFSLEGATFERVPDFNQAHFDEAPRLDSLRIEPGGFVGKYQKVKQRSPDKHPWEHAPDFLLRALAASIAQHTGWSGDPDRAARWRSLKRLAIQGHDHAREQEYFRGELLARRWREDKPWQGSFWVGVLYQLFGSFGNSVVRPIFWWLFSTAGFAAAYLAIHLERAGALPRAGASFWAACRAMWDRLFEAAPTLSCAIGPGDPVTAALGLSVSKGLFAGIGSVTRINQIHTCLYGVQSQIPGKLTPVIPDLVSFLGVAQFLLSAALIFLFGLALRNHFRIK